MVSPLIWYHWHNVKNVKNTHGGVLILAKINTPPWVFFTFFTLCKWYQNCATHHISSRFWQGQLHYAGSCENKCCWKRLQTFLFNILFYNMNCTIYSHIHVFCSFNTYSLNIRVKSQWTETFEAGIYLL